MTNQIEIPVFDGIILEDHSLFAHGFAELLYSMSPGSTITHFSSVEKAKAALATGDYHFLFTDLLIPGEDVKSFISFCRKKYPGLIIIVISTVIEISKAKECFALGVNGYLSKAVSQLELKLAIEKTYNGDSYISSDLNGRLANSIFVTDQTELTNKELEVLRLIVEGYKVDKIAATLFISPFTVMAHRRNIMKKLDLHSAAELVKYAYENKLT